MENEFAETTRGSVQYLFCVGLWLLLMPVVSQDGMPQAHADHCLNEQRQTAHGTNETNEDSLDSLVLRRGDHRLTRDTAATSQTTAHGIKCFDMLRKSGNVGHPRKKTDRRLSAALNRQLLPGCWAESVTNEQAKGSKQRSEGRSAKSADLCSKWGVLRTAERRTVSVCVLSFIYFWLGEGRMEFTRNSKES